MCGRVACVALIGSFAQVQSALWKESSYNRHCGKRAVTIGTVEREQLQSALWKESNGKRKGQRRNRKVNHVLEGEKRCSSSKIRSRHGALCHPVQLGCHRVKQTMGVSKSQSGEYTGQVCGKCPHQKSRQSGKRAQKVRLLRSGAVPQHNLAETHLFSMLCACCEYASSCRCCQASLGRV